MKKAIFNGYHMLSMSVLSAGITLIAAMNFQPSAPEGKYAFIDKEAAVAEFVFATPNFNEEDRKRVVEAITEVQKRYTDRGYAVLTKEACKPDNGVIALAAVPGLPIDITKELIGAFQAVKKVTP